LGVGVRTIAPKSSEGVGWTAVHQWMVHQPRAPSMQGVGVWVCVCVYVCVCMCVLCSFTFKWKMG